MPFELDQQKRRWSLVEPHVDCNHFSFFIFNVIRGKIDIFQFKLLDFVVFYILLNREYIKRVGFVLV